MSIGLAKKKMISETIRKEEIGSDRHSRIFFLWSSVSVELKKRRQNKATRNDSPIPESITQ